MRTDHVKLSLSTILVITLLIITPMTGCQNQTNNTNDKQENLLDEDVILYITNDFRPANEDDEIVPVNDITSIDLAGYSNIIIDKEMLVDSSKTDLQKALMNQSKIIIAGDTTENEVREYFGLEKKMIIKEENPPEKSTLQEDNMVDASQFGLAGRLIYKDEIDTLITAIRVENIGNPADLFDAYKYCFNYDYAKLTSR